MQKLKRVLPVLFTVGAIAAPAGLRAQETSRDTEKEKQEHCECFKMPGVAPRALALSGFLGNRARLGVMIDTDPDTDSIGARIEEVMDDSPADDAGLQDGDVITHVDGKSVLGGDDDESPGDRLIELMHDVEPGDTVKIDYRRGREVRTATVVTDDRGEGMFRVRTMGGAAPHVFQRTPGNFRWEAAPMGEAATHLRVLSRHFGRGLRLEAMNDGLASYFGTSEGVLVLEVDEDSELKLMPGDVILRIGSRTVDDPNRVHELLQTYRDDEAITIEVMRNKQRVTVTGER